MQQVMQDVVIAIVINIFNKDWTKAYRIRLPLVAIHHKY